MWIKIHCYIESSVLSNFPGVINFNSSHCEINLVISLSDFLPPKRHNIDINTPIKEIHVEYIDKLWIMKKIYIINRIINWLSRITKIWSLMPRRLENLTCVRNKFSTLFKSRRSSLPINYPIILSYGSKMKKKISSFYFLYECR